MDTSPPQQGLVRSGQLAVEGRGPPNSPVALFTIEHRDGTSSSSFRHGLQVKIMMSAARFVCHPLDQCHPERYSLAQTAAKGELG